MIKKTEQYAAEAKRASIAMAALSGDQKNNALYRLADALVARKKEIAQENEKDMERSEAEGLEMPLLKRLRFDEKKIADAAEGLRSLAGLPDPVGHTLMATELDEGLDLYRVSCPIGVIGVIFEARPDALVQIACLCLKSGNAVLLKGGSEALLTNRILAKIIEEETRKDGLPDGWMALLESRAEITELLKLDESVDLIIPRGSNAFVRYIMDNSRIPVMGHADGICHVYADKDADLQKAVRIVVDSKTQYVAVCNAMECLLVHEEIAVAFLPLLEEALQKSGTKLYGCEKTCAIIPAEPATPDSYRTEYLDYAMSVKVVSSLEEAILHINTYGSGHTDCIVTEEKTQAQRFLQMVDSGNVFWNCSTRFSDGFRYGFGAEVGVSTNKIHARGPVGLDGLLIYKYKLLGSGQIVEDYASRRSAFTHHIKSGDCPV